MKIIIPIAILCILIVSGFVRADPFHPGISENEPTGAPGISTDGLIRAFDMETIEVSAAKDFSTFNENAASGGGITIGGLAGQFGDATQFDGTNDELNGMPPTTPSDFTMAIWARPTADNGRVVLSMRSANFWLGYGTGLATSQRFKFSTTIGVPVSVESSQTSLINLWHSVIVFRQSTTVGIRVDGVTNTAVQAGSLLEWTTVSIGSQGGIDFFFTGDVDEVAIWNRALTTGEMQTWESIDTTADEPEVQAGPDWTIAWLYTILLIVFFVFGTRIPFMWLLAAIVALLLMIEVFNNTDNTIIGTLIGGLALFILIIFIGRILEWDLKL